MHTPPNTYPPPCQHTPTPSDYHSYLTNTLTYLSLLKHTPTTSIPPSPPHIKWRPWKPIIKFSQTHPVQFPLSIYDVFFLETVISRCLRIYNLDKVKKTRNKTKQQKTKQNKTKKKERRRRRRKKNFPLIALKTKRNYLKMGWLNWVSFVLEKRMVHGRSSFMVGVGYLIPWNYFVNTKQTTQM